MSEENELPKVGEWWWVKFADDPVKARVRCVGNGQIGWSSGWLEHVDRAVEWNVRVICRAKPWWRFW